MRTPLISILFFLSAYLPAWDQKTSPRLFGYRHAFDEPVVVVIVSILGIALATARWRFSSWGRQRHHRMRR